MVTVPTWTYQGQLITNIDDMPEGSYGFIYKVIHKPSGKKYIGKKVLYFERNKRLGKRALEALREERAKKGIKGRVPLKQKVIKESDWKDYHGSNEQVKQLRESGKLFKRRILHLCRTKGECSYYEAKLQFENDVLLRDDYYNEFIGCKIHSKFIKDMKNEYNN